MMSIRILTLNKKTGKCKKQKYLIPFEMGYEGYQLYAEKLVNEKYPNATAYYLKHEWV